MSDRIHVERLTHQIVKSIEDAEAREAPFLHLRFRNVFPDDVYAAMLREMPEAADYRPLIGRHAENLLDDGTVTRVKIDLFSEYVRNLPAHKRDVWRAVGRALCAGEVKSALMRRLSPGLERRFGANGARVGMYPVPTLTRDIPNYSIFPHTDTRWKGITVQLYLPPDDTINHIGTIFHERLADGQLRKVLQIPFSPNTGYAFAVGDNTWHSVDPVGFEVTTRDSILHTYYVDSGLLKKFRNRSRRATNFLANEFRTFMRRDEARGD
ncbi:MAG: hypothetical protein R3D62_07515 [Xanthobacteraceae bacterium]